MNCRHGEGTFTYANGNKYEGQWAHDMRCGLGTFHWADGHSWTGVWKDDLQTYDDEAAGDGGAPDGGDPPPAE